MDKKVAELNIEHFRKLLTDEINENKRKILIKLLEEEEAKLTAIVAKRAGKSKRG